MNNVNKLWMQRNLWYSLDEIAGILNLSLSSAKVFCSRATARGELVRLKRGIYLLQDKIKDATMEEKFRLANFLQSPSYVSFLTALSFYNVTTQIVISSCESVSLERSAIYENDGFIFKFIKFPKKYINGFERKGSFFIASPEKSFVDACYLCSLGRYSLDFTALDLKKINIKALLKILKIFPRRTADYLKKKGMI